MSILKCKMCGGALSVDGDSGVAVCEYCGTKQTVSKTADDVISNLYNRANNLRLKNEFDKAQNIYEKIIEQDDSEAEAHWGIVLCKYGIEYVDDPSTGKKIPTCHRTSYDSIKSDIDYQAAVDYADPSQQVLYEEEAREIDRLQKDILSIARNEKPFDVFICYKETDENGKRTVDSVIANDIYYQLTQEGFKVFYAAITLEDKLGQEYEPYIFAALNSAKVMLVIGTKPEYFNAVWVKNEWSRYLSLIKKDRTRILIPCYRDMDAYDLPDEFAHLQAQDMSKIGFINDVIRGIKKIVVKEDKSVKMADPVKQGFIQSAVNTDSLMKRANIFLEDGDYKSADEYFDRVLDQNPENGEAYLGKLLVERQLPNIDALIAYYNSLYSDENYEDKTAVEINKKHIDDIVSKYEIPNYFDKDSIISKFNSFNTSFRSILSNRIEQKQAIEKELNNNRLISRALSYAPESIKNKLNEILVVYDRRIEEAKKEDEFKVKELIKEYDQFLSNTDEIIVGEYETASRKKEADYQSCITEVEQIKSIGQAEKLIEKLSLLDGYKDSNDFTELCWKKIREIKETAIKEKAITDRKRKQKIIIFSSVTVVIAAISFLYITILAPMMKYNKAVSLFESGNYASAYPLFKELGDYKDSEAYKMNAYSDYLKDSLSKHSVDDIFTFGTYEQDNDSSNGKEEIEWVVLDKEDDRMLVISRYALDNQRFNSSRVSVTWETSSLREWLNSTFYDDAFSESEKQLILTSNITADKNPDYSTDQGNDTEDNIFLLSISEANKYFSSDSSRQCKATNYTYSKGAFKSDNNSNCWWWLRTSGGSPAHTSCVSDVGRVYNGGYYISSDIYAVRPAFWINLNK